MMRSVLGSKNLVLALAAALAAATLGCTRSQEQVSQKPMVLKVETQKAAAPSAAAHRLAELKRRHQARSLRATAGQQLAAEIAPEAASPAITGQVTLAKAEIFGREFLYSCDLQYSSLDQDGMLAQAYALGHDIVTFRQQGERLQLVADQRHMYESNINHPERLIHEFPIVKSDADTITIAISKASPTLTTVLAGAKAGAARSSWVRSLEYVPQGNYLLFETSVEDADGIVAEFMESIFPRDTIVPAGAQPLLGDPTREPLASRYRFLSTGVWLDLPEGRAKTAVASRYNLAGGKLVEWWITPNVPAQYLPLIQTAIEGWNRYSQKMWNRDIIKFRGVLPAGVKFGDPRYNVISWDSVLDAGSAYESQAFDPLTGIQSHSLIYLPYAWIKFGEEFWADGGISQAAQNEKSAEALRRFFKKGSFLGRPLTPRCFHEVAEQVSLDARRTPEEFGRELLKAVLMHEIGHGLGLAHNFKGSLSMDLDDPQAMFSTSIMDYNHYQLESVMFESEASANGPLLEYDRQMLSVLYNDAKDISSNDPVLPACDDEDTDRKEGGVDPLCIRYDAGHDPVDALIRTINLVLDPGARLGKTTSLVESILETSTLLPDTAALKSGTAVNQSLGKVINQLYGLFSFYYVNGAQSIRSMMRANTRSLYAYQPGIVPAPFDEDLLHERTAQALATVVNMSSLEPTAVAALDSVQMATMAWLQSTPWFQGLSADQQAGFLASVEGEFASIVPSVEQVYLVRTRAATLAGLVHDDAVPFQFNMDASPAQDFEMLAIKTLESALTQPLGNKMRPALERTAAATALSSFATLDEGAMAISRVSTAINAEITKARTSKEREELRSLVKALHGA